MSTFLSRLHAELRRARLTRKGATRRPEDVPRGVHKEYPRMDFISFADAEPLRMSLQEALDTRISAETGRPDKPIPLQNLATLFSATLRVRTGDRRRNYPSGGGLYPIETYLIAAAVESQKPGVYHYNPTKNGLERLWDLPESFDMKDIARHPDSLPLSALIVFTSVWDRSAAKYGYLSYQHALIEAGHMSENMLLAGTALGLQVRPYAGFDDARIAQLLDLNEYREQTVHSITLSA